MTLKQERMAEQVRSILSSLLLLEVRDPRLKGVTVTRVSLDREILFADVYVNALGDEERQDDVLTVDIVMDGVSWHRAQVIGEKIRNLISVCSLEMWSADSVRPQALAAGAQ